VTKDFSENVKMKCLLWSDRHCCLCGRAKGDDIEIAHIDPNGRNNLDNAIPLCFDCHSKIGKYNVDHPLGNRYRTKELKTRREQVYEKHTRHLVPLVDFEITQTIRDNPLAEPRKFPNVGFNIRHLGPFLPVKAKIKLKTILGNRNLGLIMNSRKPYYSGGLLWNLNPGHKTYGNFSVLKECVESTEDLRIEVQITLIDRYDRSHLLLPVCYSYVRKDNYWFVEPTSNVELDRFAAKDQR